MIASALLQRLLVAHIAALSMLWSPAVQAESGEQKFFEAYYRETVEGRIEQALKLYTDVAADRSSTAELKSRAARRAAVCREEIAATDFARLLPANALAFVELNRPGEQMLKLLGQLGLLADSERSVQASAQKIAISPAIVRELLGIRGAAAAVTGFDPQRQEPVGVAVLHPGRVEVIRGLIETALPVACQSAEPIQKYPTFNLEDKAFVTLTERLVIISNQRNLIEDVIERLRGDASDSLAENAELAHLFMNRSDALVSFFIYAKPIMPLVNGALAAAGSRSREFAIAQAVLDLNKLNALAGSIGVHEDGLRLDVALHLQQGHRNLAFNFLRMPPIDRDLLRTVPGGAAACVAFSLNEADSRFGGVSNTADAGPPVVAFLDLGREVFANIVGVAAFALPPKTIAPQPGHIPVPDAAIVFSVRDPAHSRALWSQLLGIAHIAGGGGASLDGVPVNVAGISAASYKLPEGVTLFIAALDSKLFITSSESALERAIEAFRGRQSVLDDAVFAAAIQSVVPSATLLVLAHPGRCMQVGRPFMDEEDLREIEPVIAVMSETVGSLVIEHSDQTLRLSGAITGIPRIGRLISQIIEEEQRAGRRRGRLSRAMRSGRWDEAIGILDAGLRDNPGDHALLSQRCLALATQGKDADVAFAAAEAFAERARPEALNNLAWKLLTETDSNALCCQVAQRLSMRSNEFTRFENWMFLDTPALAEFKLGNVERAIELEQKAIERCRRESDRSLCEKALRKFEAALAAPATAGAKTDQL